MELSKIDKELLRDIADLHSIPQGAFSLRKNGESAGLVSTAEITISPKSGKSGIDVHIRPGTVGKSMHLPVIITETGVNDLVYNDFYIGENCDVLIVAGCGIHNDGNKESTHNGIHNFHIAKNSKVKYVEKHLGLGGNAGKVLNPETQIEMAENSTFEMETVQLGGVSASVRNTYAKLGANAHLVITEKIKTEANQTAKTDFNVELNGAHSSVKLISRSVATGNSCQTFASNLIGNNECFGHVECDGLMADSARITSIPKIDAKNPNAQLVHEATIGKIAGEQLTKLTTLGLTPKQAEDLIIKSYLK